MGSGIKVPAGFQRGRWCREHTVIFAKVSGVKDGHTAGYWTSVKELVTEDTVVIKRAPYIEPMAPNPMKMYAAEFFKNGKLQRNKIKAHPKYPYGSCGKIFRR